MVGEKLVNKFSQIYNMGGGRSAKTAVLSPKSCVSLRKNQIKKKKKSKTDLMDNSTMNNIWFCHFLLLLNFTT